MASNQKYDNNGQYAGTGIPRYEKIFGHGFISTGGLSTTKTVVDRMVELGLNESSRVLDVGSGIGGSAFYLNERTGCDVTGVDLAPDMYNCAVSRLGDNKKVRFILGDALTLDLPLGTFDFVYTRDTLLHVKDKAGMFRRFHEYLKPGGWVVVTDYSFRSDEENLGAEFVQYFKDTGYHLCSLKSYEEAVRSAGFDVQLTDWTSRFLQSLEDEMKSMTANRADFVSVLPESDWEYLMSRWQKKVRMVNAGDMRWALIYARKH